MKQAPWDFQVHELAPDGEELHLTELWQHRDAASMPPSSGSGASSNGEPSDPQEGHLHFRLYKEGMDTMEAVARVARCLDRSPRAFRFAGTKDRCAVTVQRVSLARLRPDELRRAVLHPEWDDRILFSDLTLSPYELELGDLAGNRFCVVLRGLPQAAYGGAGGREEVGRCFRSLEENGFLNYFGLQRFGSQEIHSFQVGAAVLARRFGDALRLILGDKGPLGQPSEESGGLEAEAKDEREAAVLAAQRLFREQGDAAAAAKLMPRSQAVERGLLRSIASGLTAEEALGRLPRQVLMLYVKAAQSLVFNHVLSRRLRLGGPSPAGGDLALAEAPRGGRPAPGAGGRPWRGPKPLPPTRVLAEAEAAAACLSEVVLPLPGAAVVYPERLRLAYAETSEAVLGLPLEVFHEPLPLGLNLLGAYRPVAVRPHGLRWRLYSAEEAARTARMQGGRLLLTDVDRLRGVSPADVDLDLEHAAGEDRGLGGSAVLSCVLPPSTYLTMALRELTRRNFGAGWRTSAAA